MILLTTSDYFPKLGGLSTFTENIKTVLMELEIPFEVFHWKNYSEIRNYDTIRFEKFDFIINIHVMFCWLSPSGHEKMINFIHGSEILMTSPNFFKKILKKIRKRYYFDKMYRSNFNLFISKATENKICQRGFSKDYSRDLVFHNSINTSAAGFVERFQTNQENLVFTCIARNVPHKNLKGSLMFCELVSSVLRKKVKLILSKGSNLKSDCIEIEEIRGPGDQERNNAYTEAHYNLLLSLDHSNKGFYEGFGLTVLEAGIFGVPSIVLNTGGLSESVHHEKTGYVIESIDKNLFEVVASFNNESIYQQMRKQTFDHTVKNHSIEEYKIFIKKLMENK